MKPCRARLAATLLAVAGTCAGGSEPRPLPRNRATDGYDSHQHFLEAAAAFEMQRLLRPGWSGSREADVFGRDILEVRLAEGVAIRFRRITAGHFVEGFPEATKAAILATPSRNRDLSRWEGMMETSRRGRVTVPYDYFMSETIVTNAMFRAFVRETGYRTTVSRHRTGWIVTPEAQWLQGIANDFDQERWPFSEPHHPVIHVSWFDALQFARWLSERAGVAVRLPTFEEWALAARPHSRQNEVSVFPWGNSLDEPGRRMNFGTGELSYMWVHDQYRDGHAFTSPVRAFPPNERGLHDMVGNVWCWSWASRDAFRGRPDGDRTAEVPQLADAIAAANGPMAMHGGCYLARLTHVTLSAAMSHPALDGAEDIGFRLVAARTSQAGVPLRSP